MYIIHTYTHIIPICVYAYSYFLTIPVVHEQSSIPTINFSDLVVEEKPMAHGSFKSVYKGMWTRDGVSKAQRVAVLLLRGGDAASEIGIFERLGRHPNLVKLLAVAEKPPAREPCMVLEFAPMGSLDNVLQDLQDLNQPATNNVLLTAAGQV